MEEHGRGFLHVVSAAVEEGVKGEDGASFEVDGVGTPRNGCGFPFCDFQFVAGNCLAGIPPDADGRGRFQCLKKGFGFSTQLFFYSFYECRGQTIHF